MGKIALVTFLLTALGLSQPFLVCAGEPATPQECIEKVREAAEYLKKEGEGGISAFMEKGGKWVWKNTYTFVMDCDKMEVLAQAINPKLMGRNMAGLKDIKGNYFFIQFCERSKEPKGGWVEYWWPKPDDEKPYRKITYALQVPGSSWMVAAGIYDDAISVQELEKMLK